VLEWLSKNNFFIFFPNEWLLWNWYLVRVAGFSHRAHSPAHIQSRRRRAGIGGRERAELLAADEGRAAGDLAHLPSPAGRVAGPFHLGRRLSLQQPGLVSFDHAAQRVSTLKEKNKSPIQFSNGRPAPMASEIQNDMDRSIGRSIR
jgi:hypothetical protein